MDFMPRHHINDKRKAQSENGKENYLSFKKKDKELYNYFTNSARTYVELTSHGHHEFNPEEFSSIAPSLHLVNTKRSTAKELYCRRCQMEIEKIGCSACKQGSDHRHLSENAPDELFLCYNCRSRTLCSNCMKDICSKCRKRKKPKAVQVNRHTDEVVVKPLPALLKDQRASPEIPESDSDHELDVDLFSPVVIKKNTQPYSLYMERSSIFHPARNVAEPKLTVNVRNGEVFVEKSSGDEFDEIRRITNEKMTKYVKQNGDLSSRKPLRHKHSDDELLPLPSISEIGSRSPARNTRLYVASVRNSPAFKMLQQLEIDENELDEFHDHF